MQHTHHCNGQGLQSYPSDMQVKDVNLYIHDSGMIVTHDYSCPVCREKHAVFAMHRGIMEPCWGCQDRGYKLIKKDKLKWWERLFGLKRRYT